MPNLPQFTRVEVKSLALTVERSFQFFPCPGSLFALLFEFLASTSSLEASTVFCFVVLFWQSSSSAGCSWLEHAPIWHVGVLLFLSFYGVVLV